MKRTIEANKHIFQCTGDLFTREQIAKAGWVEIYQLVNIPSYWGQPNIFSLIDNGDSTVLSYAARIETLNAKNVPQPWLTWRRKLWDALNTKTELPGKIPDEVTIARESAVLTRQQSKWFKHRMAAFDQGLTGDCGQQFEIARGSPYILYGHYYKSDTGFRFFMTGQAKNKLIVSIFLIRSTILL